MAFFQMVRMVATTLVLLTALGWLPWVLIRPLRERLNGWIAAPFLGLAILETFSWYWLEYGTGGMSTGMVVLGVLWVAVAVIGVLRLRQHGARILPTIPAGGTLTAVVLVGATVVFSSLIMVRGLQGAQPVPTTFGNADMAHYALSAEVLLDEGFDEAGWISTADLGTLGRNDNGGVRPFIAAVALVNGTSVWHATSPALAVFVVLAAIAATWLISITTRAGPMTAALLGMATLLPFSFVFIVGQQYIAQMAAMAGSMAFLAVLLQNRPSTWRATLEAAVPATFMLVPLVLTYPQMALASSVVIGVIVVAVTLDSAHRVALADSVMSMVRAGTVIVISWAVTLVLLAPSLSALVERVRWTSGAKAGWPLPLLSPLQVLGLENFGPMTGISRALLIGPADPNPVTTLRWWIGAFLVLGLTAGATVVSFRRRSRLSLFPVTASAVVLMSYRIFYDRQGDSYTQWKWITFYQPLLTIAVLASLWILIDGLLQWLPNRRRLISALAIALGVVLVSLTLSPVLRMLSQPWWYVTDELADVQRVADSGVDHVNVALDPYAETMWAGYFLKSVRTNLSSPSYFPSSPVTDGWTLTKNEYVKSTPIREVALNSTYRLVCYREPCSPAPVLPSTG